HGNVGAHAKIVANSVDIEALISHSSASALGEAFAGGLFGDVTADATVDGSSTADVTINGGGTTIDGIYGVKIKADQNDFNVSVSRDDSAFIGIGPTLGSADNNTSLTETVHGLAGATIIAGPPSASDPVALLVEAARNGGNPDSEAHHITWSSDVI